MSARLFWALIKPGKRQRTWKCIVRVCVRVCVCVCVCVCVRDELSTLNMDGPDCPSHTSSGTNQSALLCVVRLLTRHEYSLNEQVLLNYVPAITGGDCDGGDSLAAYHFIHQFGGVTDDTCAPFLGMGCVVAPGISVWNILCDFLCA